MAPVAWPQRRVAESTRLEMSLGGFIIGVFGGARGDGARGMMSMMVRFSATDCFRDEMEKNEERQKSTQVALTG